MVLSLICATGLALGKIKVFGVSLGVTFVFFAGIIAGHFGISIDPEMLALAQNFGLILYIYSLGVQVGPGFFSSFKKGGIKANLLALLLLVVGKVNVWKILPMGLLGQAAIILWFKMFRSVKEDNHE